jgi:hypothetical protein
MLALTKRTGRVCSIFTGLAVAVAFQGCAGRAPQPVAVVQSQGKQMDCAAITAEVQANNQKVQELASEQGLKVAQNVVAGVAGFVVPVLWFGMDWQGTADKEITALQSRQQYLATLAEQRNCGGASATPASNGKQGDRVARSGLAR